MSYLKNIVCFLVKYIFNFFLYYLMLKASFRVQWGFIAFNFVFVHMCRAVVSETDFICFRFWQFCKHPAMMTFVALQMLFFVYFTSQKNYMKYICTYAYFVRTLFHLFSIKQNVINSWSILYTKYTNIN